MVDIQSSSAEIRRGKTEEEERNHSCKMSTYAMQGDHNEAFNFVM